MSLGVGFSYNEIYELCRKVEDAKKKRSSYDILILANQRKKLLSFKNSAD